MGLPFHEAGVAGLLFVPKMESIEDDDHAKRVEVRLIRRQNETLNYYEIAETLIEAERELGSPLRLHTRGAHKEHALAHLHIFCLHKL